MSSQLEWILKDHVKFAALCLARGRLAEAIMRGWMALEFAGSGLIRQPVRLLLDAALSRALNRRTPQVIANKHAPMQRQDAPAIHPAVPTDPPLSGPEPLLSVVICTYNRPSLLKTALESLEQQTARRDEFEVLVVDNDPSEQTRSAVKPFRDILQLRYVAERKTGLNHARNAGYRAARAGYVAYLDDDARAARDWVENICNIIREGNPPAIFGGPYFPFYVSEKPRWFLDCYDSNDLGDAPKQLYSSPLVTGSNIVLRKTLLQRLGGFRAEYGMSGARIRYGDETELQMRALREVTGVEVWYFPQIVVYHLVPPQKMNLRWFMSSHWAKAEASAAIDDEGGLQQYGLPALLRHLCANLALMAWGLARTLVRDRRRYPYCQNYAIEQLRPALGGISIAVTRLRRAFRGGRAAR
jgi:GT2 family glycosyltransferase